MLLKLLQILPVHYNQLIINLILSLLAHCLASSKYCLQNFFLFKAVHSIYVALFGAYSVQQVIIYHFI